MMHKKPIHERLEALADRVSRSKYDSQYDIANAIRSIARDAAEVESTDKAQDEVAKLKAQRDELLGVVQSAMKTAEFERHPFRGWHEAARAAITNATKS